MVYNQTGEFRFEDNEDGTITVTHQRSGESFTFDSSDGSLNSQKVQTETANISQSLQRSSTEISDEMLYEKVADGDDRDANDELEVPFVAGTQIVVQYATAETPLQLRFTSDDTTGDYSYLQRNQSGSFSRQTGQNEVVLVEGTESNSSGYGRWEILRDWVDRPVVMGSGGAWRAYNLAVEGLRNADGSNTIRLLNAPSGEKIRVYQPIKELTR